MKCEPSDHIEDGAGAYGEAGAGLDDALPRGGGGGFALGVGGGCAVMASYMGDAW